MIQELSKRFHVDKKVSRPALMPYNFEFGHLHSFLKYISIRTDQHIRDSLSRGDRVNWRIVLREAFQGYEQRPALITFRDRGKGVAGFHVNSHYRVVAVNGRHVDLSCGRVFAVAFG